MTAVWVTRTEPGATAMARYFRRAAIESSVAPLIDIQRISTEPPKKSFDLAVYLSQHTARCVRDNDIRAKQHLAIGSATREALSNIGIDAEVPERANSEGVVASVTEILKPGSAVLVVCGEDGLQLLPDRLMNLGYDTNVWRVYRRGLGLRRPRLGRACEIVELSSVTSVKAYWRAVRRHALMSTEEPCLVVPSRRIGKQGTLLGFQRVHVAANASARAFVRVIRRLIEDG